MLASTTHPIYTQFGFDCASITRLEALKWGVCIWILHLSPSSHRICSSWAISLRPVQRTSSIITIQTLGVRSDLNWLFIDLDLIHIFLPVVFLVHFSIFHRPFQSLLSPFSISMPIYTTNDEKWRTVIKLFIYNSDELNIINPNVKLYGGVSATVELHLIDSRNILSMIYHPLYQCRRENEKDHLTLALDHFAP